jgi:hypothetical protein
METKYNPFITPAWAYSQIIIHQINKSNGKTYFSLRPPDLPVNSLLTTGYEVTWNNAALAA